jgi:hypothetical protein
MANEEALTIDGLAVNDGVTFGMLTFDAPVPRQRQDWIGAADSEAQLLIRNPLHENRKLTAKISVIPQSTMDLAHDKLLLILDKLQKASKYTDGITVTWAPATGTDGDVRRARRGDHRPSDRLGERLPREGADAHDRADVQAVLARHGDADQHRVEQHAVRDARGRERHRRRSRARPADRHRHRLARPAGTSNGGSRGR